MKRGVRIVISAITIVMVSFFFFDFKSNTELNQSAATERIFLKGNLEPSIYHEKIYRYSRIRNDIFYEDTKIMDADPVSFGVVENGSYAHSYAKDKNNMYFKNLPIVGSDIKTFQILWQVAHEGCESSHYSKDRSNIYFENKIVKGVDLGTFKIYTSGYARDNKHVFKEGIILRDLDPDTFDFDSVCQYV